MPADHNFGSDDKASGTKRVALSAWWGEQSSGSPSWAHGWRLASGQREERLPSGPAAAEAPETESLCAAPRTREKQVTRTLHLTHKMTPSTQEFHPLTHSLTLSLSHSHSLTHWSSHAVKTRQTRVPNMWVCTADAFLKQGSRSCTAQLWPPRPVVVRRCPLYAVASWEARCGLRLLSQFGRFTRLQSVTDGTGTIARSMCFFRVCHCAPFPHTQTDLRSFTRPVSRRCTTAIRLPRWSSCDRFEIDIFVSSTCILDIITLVPSLRDSALVCSLPSVTHRRPSGVYSGSPSDSR